MQKFHKIASFSHTYEAHLYKSRLESEGIACSLDNENLVAANWLYSNAVGGVQVKVQEKDYDKAREILKEIGYVDDEKKEKEKRTATIDPAQLKQFLIFFGIMAFIAAIVIMVIPK